MIAPGLREPPEMDENDAAAIRAALARLRSGPAPVVDPATKHVYALISHHCLRCHLIDGVGGKDGPELSKIGDKLDPGMIERRLIDPKSVKADAEMPSFADKLSPEEMKVIAGWLGKRK